MKVLLRYAVLCEVALYVDSVRDIYEIAASCCVSAQACCVKNRSSKARCAKFRIALLRVFVELCMRNLRRAVRNCNDNKYSRR